MLSFTNGRPIAIIKDGEYNNKIVHLDVSAGDEDNSVYVEKITNGLSQKQIDELYNAIDTNNKPKNKKLSVLFDKLLTGNSTGSNSITIESGTVEPLPNFEKPFRMYVAGPSGSGKSYFVSQILEKINRVQPNRKIYIISDVNTDEAFDNIKNIIRLKIDEKMLFKKPIEPAVFADGLVLFDDIDSIQNKKLSKLINILRDSILTRGRHENISCIVTNHLLTNYKDTRIILNECNSFTFFPKSGASAGIKRLLETYVGIDKANVDDIFKLKSRAVTVYTNYPLHIIYEKGVYILS